MLSTRALEVFLHAVSNCFIHKVCVHVSAAMAINKYPHEMKPY